MQLAAIVTFGVTLFLILVLFALKRIEIGRGQRFAESFRAYADSGALRLKRLLAEAERNVAETPWLLGAFARWSVHVGALSFARLARVSAEYAHRLADFVSHKHTFERTERTETKSRFLKEVSEYRNGNGESGEGRV